MRDFKTKVKVVSGTGRLLTAFEAIFPGESPEEVIEKAKKQGNPFLLFNNRIEVEIARECHN